MIQPTTNAEFSLRLFGGFELCIAGHPVSPEPGRRQQELLALLALAHGKPVRRDMLAQTLWPFPDYSTENANFYLRRTLSELKRTLQGQAYRLKSPTQQTLALDITANEVDIVLFEELARSEDPTKQQQAAKIYRNPLLTGYTDPWVLQHRERLEALYQSLNRIPPPEVQVAPSVEAEPRRTPGYLPTPITTLVGREGLLTALKEQICRTRLLTLIGPGGAGKTRLAIALAAAVQQQFPDGVWFVDLAALTDPTLLPHVIADTLRVRARLGQDLLSALAEFLQPRSLLLLLDNCEHLRDSCAPLIVELLHRCHNLKVLATTREALNIHGETLRRIPGLGVLDPESLHADPVRALRQVVASGAGQLFLNAAQAVWEDFHITSTSVYDVARLCYLLDGLPLALELAAARIAEQSVSDLNAYLEDDLTRLKTASYGVPARHRSLDTCLRWSWERLTSIEQRVLQHLTVFAGSWTQQAAEAVCKEACDVAATLVSLANKSLVMREDGDRETRYRLLETVRQFARQSLPPDEEATLRYRHLAYYRDLVDHACLSLYSPQHDYYLNVLDQELANVRAALGWSLRSAPSESTTDTLSMEQDLTVLANPSLPYSDHVPEDRDEKALSLANTIWWYHQIRGRMTEAREWLWMGLKAIGGGANGALRGGVYASLGHLAMAQGDSSAAYLCYEQAISELRLYGSVTDLGYTLYAMGDVAIEQEDFTAAQHWLKQAIDVLNINAEDLIGIALSQITLAEGDFDKARRLITGSLESYRQNGVTSRVIECLVRLTDIERAAGRSIPARKCVREALTLASNTRNLLWLPRLFWRKAALAQSQEDTTTRLLGAADGLMDSCGATWTLRERRMQEDVRAVCLAAQGKLAYERSLAAGKSLSWQQAVELAIHSN